ncbi:DUF3861 domain-containing protein [Vibrio algarum]|uniref:DUF3861 domain-containing protein n=1 Tax=Vibrio algarum TaxID=3020714 RepID=A0ABT4YVM5_9VIBR|nr:DUF3861 domain-containing protein [Vibrio sp. KJ40-1]MDB1125069.1 DUF3861 domain-containing protein [Vibrio sp. KJ40-1]
MKSLIKKNNTYRVTIEDASSANGETPRILQFEVEDREDMFTIVEKLKQGSGLDEQDATKVGVALRLVAPVMMQNRKHVLFADFMPHFKHFMVNLKKAMKGN